eukprot:TRINITY_DN26552_c0_g5_i1.p1 TRINITY_DN26552_c0_g5~~TRINITY_DN26552_c0_g5_i1.p1  ORF type:complete len:707 (-),score=172.85 TRINITY_DN26552_c0_g5_i1:60-2180(-)
MQRLLAACLTLAFGASAGDVEPPPPISLASGSSVRSPAVGAVAPADVELLRKRARRLAEDLAEMEAEDRQPQCSGAQGASDLKAWTEAHCGADAATSSCRLVIRQDVQRFGRFEHMAAEGDQEELTSALDKLFRAERLELQQKARQLRQLLAFLDGDRAAAFSEAEVREQIAQARRAEGDAPTRVVVSLIAAADAETSVPERCDVLKLVKPSDMYYGAPRAESNPKDVNGEPEPVSADLAAVLARSVSLYQSSFTMANDRYAAHHPLITYVWLYALNLWATLVPCSGSGPFMPEASSNFACIGFLPWWNMFGPGVSIASPLGIVTETANPGALSWFTSCEYGLLTFSPHESARSSCWMLPIVGQTAQLIPGRMIPDRTVFGSHPSSILNFEGRPDIYSKAETYLAADAQGYDPDLVSMLYALDALNGSFAKVTFFTTSLTHLAFLGWYPQSAALQHHGVQLTLHNSSSKLMGKRSSEDGGFAEAGARVLTLEMMSEGLLWSLRDSDLKDVHSTETYEFEHIPARVVADYVLDQKGTTYRDANCQAYAKNLVDRLLFHGQGVRATAPLLGSAPEITLRFALLLLLVALALATSAAVQWLVCWRAFVHLRCASEAIGADAAGGASKLWRCAAGLGSDAARVEEWLASLLGAVAAARLRRAAVLLAMLQCPPLFLYVTYDAYAARRKTTVDAKGFALLPDASSPAPAAA